MNMNQVPPVFRLEQASVAFRTPHGIELVLDDIHLDIRKGEWVTLVGRNGSGKSTLAKVLAGLLPLSRGTLTTREGLRPRIVFQQPEAQIVGETVFEDIAFGLECDAVDPSDMKLRALEALAAVGLAAALEHPARELSGGQKQLLAAAGCLALDAGALIFDEATSMLDPLGRERLLGAVRKLHKEGATVVWVTQLLEETAAACRIVAIDRNKIAYDGDVRGFFYGDGGSSGRPGPCEQLGFTPPFAVQVAKRLLSEGQRLLEMPVSPEQLTKAVAAVCRS
jgi:energy-coupling factor transport system ATP-binding protein